MRLVPLACTFAIDARQPFPARPGQVPSNVLPKLIATYSSQVPVISPTAGGRRQTCSEPRSSHGEPIPRPALGSLDSWKLNCCPSSRAPISTPILSSRRRQQRPCAFFISATRLWCPFPCQALNLEPGKECKTGCPSRASCRSCVSCAGKRGPRTWKGERVPVPVHARGSSEDRIEGWIPCCRFQETPARVERPKHHRWTPTRALGTTPSSQPASLVLSAHPSGP